MNTAIIKKFCKDNLLVTVKCRTIACKARWMEARMAGRVEGTQLVYDQSFPVEFRKMCLKIVYPDSPELQAQSSAGNIESHCISMYPHQWEQAINQWHTTSPTKA